jgi:macrophage erythroblast attacher
MEFENAVMNNGTSTGAPVAVTAPPPPRLNDQTLESLKLEHQLVKVPYEQLKKVMRISTRLVEKEVNAVVAGVADVVDKDMSKEEVVQHLTSLVSRLQGLKRKVCVFGISSVLQSVVLVACALARGCGLELRQDTLRIL